MGNDCEQVETWSESDVLSKHCEIQLGVVCGIQVGAVMIGVDYVYFSVIQQPLL